NEIEVSVGRIKFVAFPTTSSDTNQDTSDEERISGSETDISSNSDDSFEDGEAIDANEIVTINSHQVSRSYSSTPVVHIANISNATPRQFFEHFIPVDFIMSVVISSTNRCARECECGWSNLTWPEFIKFIGILTIMTYVKCVDICDYWSIKQEMAGVLLAFGQYMSHQQFRNIIKYLTLIDIPTNNDPFHFARQFHDEFNENLTKAILPGPYLCIDESMCQWIGKVDKGPFQRKIPRKPHPIGCEFKALADVQINLFLRLDPAEPSEYAMKKKFSDQYVAVVASMLRLIKKRCYWPKNIPNDITGVLENTYGSSISQVCKISDVDFTVYSIRDRKDIVLLASYSTTTLRTEINRYIKGYGNATFHRPIVFDEYNEFRSAVDILNKLLDNSLSYHEILGSKCSADRVFAFYLTVAEANSFSAYCRFVPGKKNMKHVDFRKQLAKSIFNCYSDNTIADRTKKR
ncbi:18230_t:CDS:2, partial [Funneliformis geosporum]